MKPCDSCARPAVARRRYMPPHHVTLEIGNIPTSSHVMSSLCNHASVPSAPAGPWQLKYVWQLSKIETATLFATTPGQLDQATITSVI
jgi:hypothetical protein